MDRLVSIVIPVFNAEKTLNKTLESVFSQTYPQIEVVISDNHSQDGTDKIIDKYRQKTNLKVVRPPRHISMYANFNFAANNSSGKILKFLCADDLLVKNAINEMVTIFDSYPDVGLIQTQGWTINNIGEIVGMNNFVRTGSGHYIGRSLKNDMIPCPDCITPTHMVLNREVLNLPKDTSIFDDKYISADWDFYLSCLEKTNIYRTEQRLIKYRTGGYHTRKDTTYFLDDAFKIAKKHYMGKNHSKYDLNSYYVICDHYSRIYILYAVKNLARARVRITLNVLRTLRLNHYLYRALRSVVVSTRRKK